MKYSVTGRYLHIAVLAALLGLLVLWVALSLSGRHMTGSAGLPVAKPSGRETSGYERLPLGFEPNRGQALPNVRYLAHGAGSVVALTDHGALLRLASSKARPGGELGIGFVAGSRPLALVAQQGLRGKVNYLIGNDRSRWHTGIPTFGSVLARRVWPGIDAVFSGDQRRLRYDFRLASGADAGRIWVAFAGARYVRVDRDGGLAVGVAGGVVRQPRPSAYQVIAGERRAVAVNYVVSHGRLGVSVGGYDHRQPLVIDPTLDYSTYLGGSGGEYCGTAVSPPAGACIAIHEGHAYITGTTDSTDFPTMPGAYQSAHGGGTGNAFVSKFTPDGSALEYSTYIAGRHCCYVWDRSIAVDSTGAAYITGTTNQDDFPTSPGVYINTSATAPYVSKLSPDGSSLDYSTYLCDTSSVNWTGMAIAVDSTGH
ncbi:MAG: DUF7948 domain-containing protein, partial [Solirubrobacteraceae bacterium]